jgi:hypothetical protein
MGDNKFFVIAHLEPGQDTRVEWLVLDDVRPFIDRRTTLGSSDSVTEALIAVLPPPDELQDAIVRLTVEYPREWDSLIDEPALRRHAAAAFEFHFVRRPRTEARIRLPADQTVSSLSPLDLLDQYWLASKTDPHEARALQELARSILSTDEDNDPSPNPL